MLRGHFGFDYDGRGMFKLTDEEIDYVLYALRHNSSRVGNIRSYLITTLYNSKSTVSNYYANMAYNDIREGVV